MEIQLICDKAVINAYDTHQQRGTYTIPMSKFRESITDKLGTHEEML